MAKEEKKITKKEKEVEDATYMSGFARKFLQECKKSPTKKLMGDALYAQYFGKSYTFLFNTVPVNIRFDGTVQEFPEPIYNRLVAKLQEVSKSNVRIETDTEISYK